MGGATQQRAQYNGSWMAGFDLAESYPDIHSISAANQLDKDACGSSASAWTLASFLGRVAYNYDSRYLLTVNFRADGSSRFAPDIVGVLSLLFLQVGEFQAKSSCNLYKTLLPT